MLILLGYNLPYILVVYSVLPLISWYMVVALTELQSAHYYITALLKLYNLIRLIYHLHTHDLAKNQLKYRRYADCYMNKPRDL